MQEGQIKKKIRTLLKLAAKWAGSSSPKKTTEKMYILNIYKITKKVFNSPLCLRIKRRKLEF